MIFEEIPVKNCSCGRCMTVILRKKEVNWSLEEIMERSKSENHPIVHAIFFHDYETLRKLLSDSDINVNFSLFKYESYSIQNNGNVFDLICTQHALQSLITLAFTKAFDTRKPCPKVVDCLLSFGAQLDSYHLRFIFEAEASFCKELLFLGSLREDHFVEMRNMLETSKLWRKIPDNDCLTEKEKEILNAINLWSKELILFYCLDKKHELLFF